MTYHYTAIFHNSKKASFGGSVDIEQLKADGTDKRAYEIMKEVKSLAVESTSHSSMFGRI